MKPGPLWISLEQAFLWAWSDTLTQTAIDFSHMAFGNFMDPLVAGQLVVVPGYQLILTTCLLSIQIDAADE